MNKNDQKKQFNEKGYLLNFEEWDEALARKIAAQESLPQLEEQHYRLIGDLRGYYEAFNEVPMVRNFCKLSDISIFEIFSLFPTGYTKGALKIAGLPQPDYCKD